MRVAWYGQSAFRLQTDGASVFIDPFGDVSGLTSRGIQWEYPAIENVAADLVLVTHEHTDHNGIEAVQGSPQVLRSTAGRLPSAVGEVLAIAAEHDASAGTERGPNTIFVFALDGLRVAHFGDFGQSALREEQAAAIGQVEMVFMPVGGGPTIGAAEAAEIVERLSPRWVVPMHYRTSRVNFLEPADPFLERVPASSRVPNPWFETNDLPLADHPIAIVPAAP